MSKEKEFWKSFRAHNLFEKKEKENILHINK